MKLRIDKRRLEQVARVGRAEAGPRARLLVVDDEEENLFSLVRLLERRYEVRSTTDPRQALEMVKEAPVDVVITDQRMPGMLGTELLAAIKAVDDDNARMILTGYTDARDLITCINEGLVHRYLVKPWRIAELEAVVEQGLSFVTHRRTVRKLIPHQVLDRLYGGRLQEAKPGEGKLLECAVLFLDIRGFTTLSERLDPHQTFQLLTSYMSAVAPLIGRHHGYVDKYLGDGMLAIFDREGRCGADALAAARDLVRETERYNAEHLPSGQQPLSVGVGIASGQVVLGTVGFPGRLEFTVLGDAVNTAHRIQELTKQYDCAILADAAVVQGTAVPGRALGGVSVRGKDRPVELHLVLA